MARARRVRLGGSVEEGVLVRADPAGLSRVVANLVMNAIRHTPADGTVEITGRAVPDGVELSVADGCGGIPADDLDRVFDVAWRGSHARTPADGRHRRRSRPGDRQGPRRGAPTGSVEVAQRGARAAGSWSGCPA